MLMSTWQSFFNQLSKPINNDDSSTISNKICHCNRGTLVLFGNNSYHPQGECSLSSVCCSIQIDKHRAFNFNNRDSILKKPKISSSEKSSSSLFPLDAFLNR